MSNENNVRIDTIYKCLVLDGIKCKYSRYAAEHVAYIDYLIKKNLREKHGWRGLLLSFQLDWKFVFKLVFHDPVDILPIKQCSKFENKCCIQNVDEQKYRLFDITQSLNKLKHTLHTMTGYMNLKTKWKPFHPYTYAKYQLTKYHQKHLNDNNFKHIWLLHPVAVFQCIEWVVTYFVPIVHTISTVLNIMFIFQYHPKDFDYNWKNECQEFLDVFNKGYVIAYTFLSIWVTIFGSLYFCCMYVAENEATKRWWTVNCIGYCIGMQMIFQCVIVFMYFNDSCWYNSQVSTITKLYIVSAKMWAYTLLAAYPGIWILSKLYLILPFILLYVIFFAGTFCGVGFFVGMVLEIKSLLTNVSCESNSLNAFFSVMLSSIILMFAAGLIHTIIGRIYARNWSHLIFINDIYDFWEKGLSFVYKSRIERISDYLLDSYCVIFVGIHTIFSIIYFFTSIDDMKCRSGVKKIQIISICCYITPFLMALVTAKNVKQDHFAHWLSITSNWLFAIIHLFSAWATAKDDD
eukprot:171986_1